MGDSNCIKNTLKLIALLQNNSRDMCCNNSTCCKRFLGPSISLACYNTRVITLYNKKGQILSFNYINNLGSEVSTSTFRVQEVKDNCCKLLLLDYTDGNYVSLKQTVIVNLDCIAAIKCLGDVIVSNL